MNIIPDPRHPWWCAPTACRVNEPPVLDDSGDVALSSFGTGQHYGDVAAVPRQRFDEVLISAQLAAVGDEPIDSTPVSVDLTVTRPTYRSVELYTLTAEQVRGLVVALGSLLPALVESGPPRRREDVEADGCRAWCSGGHAPDYPTCSRDVVEDFTLAPGTTAHVQVHQWADDDPCVSLYEHTADETVVTTVSPAAARELGLALLAAGALGGAR